jgi:hypothetical protein
VADGAPARGPSGGRRRTAMHRVSCSSCAKRKALKLGAHTAMPSHQPVSAGACSFRKYYMYISTDSVQATAR